MWFIYKLKYMIVFSKGLGFKRKKEAPKTFSCTLPDLREPY